MLHIKSESDYNQQYKASVADPKKFWSLIAESFFWFKKSNEVMNCDFSKGKIEWFLGGKTNLSYNCLDRHLESDGDKVAIIWEGNDILTKSQKITYKELHEQVCQFSNLLIAHGIKKGDRVCIYMPMIPQSLVVMLACARIGAVHCVVFAGFSAAALAGRIQDCGAKILITSDLLFRGDKKIILSEIANEAVANCDSITNIILFKRDYSNSCPSLISSSAQTLIWQDEIEKYSTKHEAEIMDSEDPLFILYTSGSTGKPKGILHTTSGYMVYAGYSFQNVFQYRQGEVFFCSADIGWITGHSYLAYGPLLNGATILMFEGIPTHPTPARFWKIIEKHRVNIFYTAPTAIRALMQKGDEFVNGHDLSSLHVLGTVGEPINEEAWQWYFEKIGNKKCPIVDTWWQTETGGILISALAGITKSKPAHAGFPLPGIVPILFDDAGKEISEKNKVGNLCFAQAWPGMARTVWNDHEKFIATYYEQFPGYYFSGDGAFLSDAKNLNSNKEFAKDAQIHSVHGNSNLIEYRIIGRTDDVIKVSGHRLGTAEIENAINSHEKVSESAVIGVPHKIKGEGIYAFVSRKSVVANHDSSDEDLKNEIIKLVQNHIGSIAKPDKIFLVNDLPKTRSGKIMRRILKKIVAGEENLGDISTLVNPDSIEILKTLFV